MKEYLLYLLGELTEYHSGVNPNSRYWKNDEYGVVLEYQLDENHLLYVHNQIWTSFSTFFNLTKIESIEFITEILEEFLYLKGIKVRKATLKLYVNYSNFDFDWIAINKK